MDRRQALKIEFVIRQKALKHYSLRKDLALAGYNISPSWTSRSSEAFSIGMTSIR